MENINELGKVYNSDILILGGGIAGLVTAIKAKECNEDLDVLVVDKGTIGWTGQATKAGNGILASAPDQPIEKFAEFIIKDNGDYLNDQEFLLDYMSTNLHAVEELARWGVRVSKNPDGSIKPFRLPNNLWSTIGIELNCCAPLRKYALKIGVRLLSRVQIFELLTNSGRVIGAIGFDMEHTGCHIFRAKAVGVSTHGACFKKMGGFFMGSANGLGATYRVGAQMRNCEFSTEPDVVYKATFNPVYRGHNIVHNKDGVNISDIYAPGRIEVTTELILGMFKEVREGRGPLYVDLSRPDPLRSLDDPLTNVNNQRFYPDKMEWGARMKKKAGKYGTPITEMPEVTVKYMLQAECLKVDREYRTNVEGLWGPGKISDKGSAYFGFVRGDGLGNAVQSALRAARSMAKYAASTEFKDADVQQIKTLKEKIFAPLNRKTTRKPTDIFNKIEDMAFHVEKMMEKTDETINNVLAEVQELYKLVPELTANDAHTLAKCHEAADSILALEMIYRAALMRTESRGGKYKHYRADYPERDDKNWLKWINVQQGENGEMELVTEDIPMERYPYKPEGYVSK